MKLFWKIGQIKTAKTWFQGSYLGYQPANLSQLETGPNSPALHNHTIYLDFSKDKRFYTSRTHNSIIIIDNNNSIMDFINSVPSISKQTIRIVYF
jgi:hypothetical protein